jgi:L-threonylcarbamoyladenylate synthase
MNLISIVEATELIQNENIVALPTETVYGLFGLGNSQKAVQKVYEIKNRPADNPLICHFWNYEQILEHTINQPEYLETLIKNLSPGPVTFLLELNPNSDLQAATAGQSKICCRIPDSIITLEVLKRINTPLFGPSANSSTKVSGTNPTIIDQDLGVKISGIVDGGNCTIGLESTIIDCTREDQIRILRPGAIGEREIRETLLEAASKNENTELSKIIITEEQKSKITTPGAKYRHYSPRTKIIKTTVIPNSIQNLQQSSDYILALEEDLLKVPDNYQKLNLGSIKNPEEIAHNLFHNLFELDKLNQQSVYFYFGDAATELFSSNNSIPKAIINRLEKVFSD